MSDSKLDTGFAEAKDSPGFLLWQLSNKWQAQQRQALRPFDLTHVQFVLLASLTFAAGTNDFTQKDLARHAQTDEMMTSQVVRKLEQKGLVLRQACRNDGRAFTVSPTEQGVRLANQAVRAVEAVDRQFFHIGPADMAVLVRLMQQLTQAI